MFLSTPAARIEVEGDLNGSTPPSPGLGHSTEDAPLQAGHHPQQVVQGRRVLPETRVELIRGHQIGAGLERTAHKDAGQIDVGG